MSGTNLIENVYDVIKAAYLINDEELLKKATKFIGKNHGTFKFENPQWDEFKNTHPKCFVKMMEFMFDNQNNPMFEPITLSQPKPNQTPNLQPQPQPHPQSTKRFWKDLETVFLKAFDLPPTPKIFPKFP